MPSDTGDALAWIREALLTLDPTGAGGFEGLLANALASLSGLTIRLSKSGLQYGRDGSSDPTYPFAISLEAKLYKDSPSLAELAGKAAMAGVFLSGEVDLWAVGCTAEIGDLTVQTFTDLLEDRGVTALTLDWAQTQLPPLAILLAATRSRTVTWFAQWALEEASGLEAALAVVAADPFFAEQAERLRRKLQAAEVGLDALRQKSASWHKERFRDPQLSQISFGQRIVIGAPSAPALPRIGLVEDIRRFATPAPDDLAILAVLGGEGAGKTWLVSQWWTSLIDPPVLVFVPSRVGATLDASDPTGALAGLIASLDNRGGEGGVVAVWKRRLERWKGQGVGDKLRFVILLDGMNERATAPWADLILSLAREARALGGLVIVTAREGYWSRDVAPRLGSAVEVREVHVPDYSDAELAAVLARIQRTPSELPTRVREFIRNPRVCAAALKLLPRLVKADELTIERLLVEYWEARVEERASGIRHNPQDFRNLLRAHANAWLKAPKAPFDRDDWAERSGAAKRLGTQAVVDDLTEIEEGRFWVSSSDKAGYVFRNETLPFALGLLINDELKSGLRDGKAAREILDSALSPVEGFDRLADIMAAAAGLACLDETFPAEGRRAIIVYWLGLHNVDTDAYETMAAYVPARPDAFLDVVELSRSQMGHDARQHSLTGLLAGKRDHPNVWAAIERRLPTWLGQWSRDSTINFRDGKDAERQGQRDRSIAETLNNFSASETVLFRSLTNEVAIKPEMSLQHTAAMLLSGCRQSAFADGLVGWALADAVAGDFPTARVELDWAIRLNVIDWTVLHDRVHARIGSINGSASARIRIGTAGVLRMLGDARSAEKADVLNPQEILKSWRRVERLCDADPFDPEAVEPTNLENARSIVTALTPSEIWLHMSSTALDHDLEDATPGLQRFAPSDLIAKLREIVATASSRTGLALRQLSWRLPGLAPLYDDLGRTSVVQAYYALVADPARVPESDSRWVLSQLAESLMPGASAEEQLDLLLRLPAKAPLYLNMRRGLVALPIDVLEKRLEDLLALGEAEPITRLLFFMSGAKPDLSARVRGFLVDRIFGEDALQADLAAEVGAALDDRLMCNEIVARLGSSNAPVAETEDAFSFGRLMTLAIVKTGSKKLVDRIPQRFLGFAAAQMGGTALERLGRHTDVVLNRLLGPISASPPGGVDLYYGASRDQLHAFTWHEEAETECNDPAAFFDAMNDGEQGARRFAERQNAVISELKTYRRALTEEGAAALNSAPPLSGLMRLAQENPALLGDWLQRILDTQEGWRLRQIRNLGLAIASAGAWAHGDRAANVFCKLWRVDSPTQVVVGTEKFPLPLVCLFQNQAEALKPLWADVLNGAWDDDALQTAILAAEDGVATGWLDRYVDECLSRPEPAHQARGLVVAALRGQNPHSDKVLGAAAGAGFLAAVLNDAQTRYARARWCRHWLDMMAAAPDREAFWRYGQLALGCCDRRALKTDEWIASVGSTGHPFLADFLEQLVKAVQERSKKRTGTLFGLTAPSRQLAPFLSESNLL